MTNKTQTSADILASARASRAAAEAFRLQVERLRGVSFEGTLTAVVEFRVMAREMARGLRPADARDVARSHAASLGYRTAPAAEAPLPMAAE